MTPKDPVIAGVPHVYFGANQPQYTTLPAIVVEGPEGQVLTRWALSDEDRARIAAGGDVFLAVYTFGQGLQPVAVFTEPPEIAVLHADGVRILKG